MPARIEPLLFEATRDFVWDGVQVTRGDLLSANPIMGEPNFNALVAARWIAPDEDVYGRKTDNFGFGGDPRANPTPTYYSPAEIASVLA